MSGPSGRAAAETVAMAATSTEMRTTAKTAPSPFSTATVSRWPRRLQARAETGPQGVRKTTARTETTGGNTVGWPDAWGNRARVPQGGDRGNWRDDEDGQDGDDGLARVLLI